MRITKLLVCMVVAMLLCSCDKSPMAKLKSNKSYPELAKIWSKEHAKNSKLWQEAVEYCNARAGWFEYRSEKPNCKDVMEELSPDVVTGKLDANPINDTFDFK